MRPFRYFMFLALAINSTHSYAETFFSSGLFYLQGQASTTDKTPVSTWSVPLTLSYWDSAWLARVSTSWLQQSADQYNDQATNGLGDTYFSLGYTSKNAPNLQLSLEYKLATGDESKGFSTGDNDVSLQLDYFQPFNPQYAGFVTISYSINGKPKKSDIQNTRYVSVGLNNNMSARWQLGMSVDYQQSLYSTLDDQTALSLYTGYFASAKTSWGLMTSYDNTETLNLGVSFQRKF